MLSNFALPVCRQRQVQRENTIKNLVNQFNNQHTSKAYSKYLLLTTYQKLYAITLKKNPRTVRV